MFMPTATWIASWPMPLIQKGATPWRLSTHMRSSSTRLRSMCLYMLRSVGASRFSLLTGSVSATATTVAPV